MNNQLGQTILNVYVCIKSYPQRPLPLGCLSNVRCLLGVKAYVQDTTTQIESHKFGGYEIQIEKKGGQLNCFPHFE